MKAQTGLKGSAGFSANHRALKAEANFSLSYPHLSLSRKIRISPQEMGFLRRIAGILGFSKDEPHETRDVDDDNDVVRDRTSKEEVDVEDIRLHRRGFSVPAQVSVDRDRGPILIPCTSGDGGVQVHSLSCLFACSGYMNE